MALKSLNNPPSSFAANRLFLATNNLLINQYTKNMKKITLLLTCLLTFAGLAQAQEAGTYDDPATAPGVVPATSTTDGTKFAYYLRNYGDKTKFIAPAFTEVKTSTDTQGKLTTSTDEATQVVFVRNGSNYDVYSVLSDGTLAARWRGDRPFLWMNKMVGGYYNAMTLTQVTTDNDDIVYTVSCGSRYLHINRTDEKYLEGGNASQATSQWQLIPANDAAKKAAELSIKVLAGDDVHGNLATFSASYPVAKPAGYTVYTATYNSSTSAFDMTELTGDVIPGNTGVIVKGAVSDAVSMQPTLAAAPTATSALTPTNEGTFTVDATTTAYGLGANTLGVLGFYKMNNGSVGANKAYYTATTSGSAIAFNFGGNATGIHNAQVAPNADAPLFDISGRRVAKAVKGGLYIQNGKKVIVK